MCGKDGNQDVRGRQAGCVTIATYHRQCVFISLCTMLLILRRRGSGDVFHVDGGGL